MAAKFEPKEPVNLDPPKNDPISVEELAKATERVGLTIRAGILAVTNGSAAKLTGTLGDDGGKCYVAIKGKVYDVTGNKAYQPGGSYHVFAGKDASRALAKVSTKEEDVRPEWQDLPENEKKVLDDWVTYFSKRYNVVGRVEGASNME